MSEQWLIAEKVLLRPDDAGNFDELLLQDGDDCLVHAEMMDADLLWVGIHPKGEQDRVVMWIRAHNGKLKIRVERE